MDGRASDRGRRAFVSLAGICNRLRASYSWKASRAFCSVPMAEAVMFAMNLSFILSRTLVPTMANLPAEPHHRGSSWRERRDADSNPRELFFQRRLEARLRGVARSLARHVVMALAIATVFICVHGFVLASFC